MTTPRTTKTRVYREWVPPVLFFVFFVVGWELVVRLVGVPEYLVPAASSVILEIGGNFWSLVGDTLITMAEAILGFLIANICGILLAVAFVHSKSVERGLYPYAIALKAVPLIAIAPLLIMWFGNGMLGKVIMAAIISFFPVLVNATIGLKSIDRQALDLMHSLSASQSQILLKLRFPSALPYIFSGLKISSTLSVIGAIVAELSGATEGIGYVIMIASYRFETVTLFSAIIAASIGGIIFFGVLSLIERRYLSWHESSIEI